MADGGGVVTLTGTTITYRSLTLYGRADLGRFSIQSLEGWEDLPSPRQDSVPRPHAHGRFGASVYSDERHVLVSGRCNSIAERDALLLELKATFNLHTADAVPLAITHAGRTLTSNARLLRFKSSSPDWGGGFIEWAVEWVCDDPLRYGAQVQKSAVFAVLVGGLEYDLYTDGTTDTGWLEFGTVSISDRVSLSNTGDEDVWPQFEVTGPVAAEGFDIICLGNSNRLRYEGAVSSGSTLVIDSATGSVMIDGYADRTGLLTVREWTAIPAGGSADFTFLPLGATSGAVLTAFFAPGWW